MANTQIYHLNNVQISLGKLNFEEGMIRAIIEGTKDHKITSWSQTVPAIPKVKLKIQLL